MAVHLKYVIEPINVLSPEGISIFIVSFFAFAPQEEDESAILVQKVHLELLVIKRKAQLVGDGKLELSWPLVDGS